ncbi:MAG TPA: Rieske 2Fe-2S domain-containing protein [Acidimicrobiales bacterium]|nr:Rieske 2Fe-2S domain-containing protein [Acidimicrobiales bacterium]
MSESEEAHVTVDVTGPAGDSTGDGSGSGTGNGYEPPVVTLPAARADDPHLQGSARHPRRVEAIIGLFFLVGIAGVCAFGGAFVVGAGTQVYAATLFVGLFCLGFGLTAWGKYLMPQGPFVEDRHSMASSATERQAMAAALVERTGIVVKRRRVLGGLLVTGLGVFGVVAAFPLIRSLGPQPRSRLFTTNWKKGSLLVDQDGKPVHRTDMQVGGLLTVFPKGKQSTTTAQAVDQAVLLRVQSTKLVTMKGRGDWAPDGFVAYSKVCTHLGCPVGLYEQELELLVCPCHQSMFNVRDGAFPIFGPAPRPLPQLPIYFDSTGFLRARKGFNQPIGPGFWERSTIGDGKAPST